MLWYAERVKRFNTPDWRGEDIPMNRLSRRSASPPCARRARLSLWLAIGAIGLPVFSHAVDISAPPILQMFEASYRTTERRSPDIFAAGYGGLWIPPIGRADQSDFSVGYDQYDRFDLGYAGKPTLYGTESGIKQMNRTLHRGGMSVYVDLVWNHNGFTNLSNAGFTAAGGYPGFVMSRAGDVDGDFHGAFETGDWNGRTSNLIDIAQEKNYQYIRNPVEAGDSRNLPAGTTSLYGRLANVPTEANRRFYPNRDVTPARMLFDPSTGESNIPVYDFSSNSATTGDPVTENGLGYLMRNAQWMIQEIGVDGYRIDAQKHMPQWVMNYLDRAVYRANPRTNIDGSVKHVFSFGEVYDGNKGLLQSYVRKDINPNDIGRIGGNRDVLDFPLYWSMSANLTSNGLQNDWRNVVGASQDTQDDGFGHNGSQAVSFVEAHDQGLAAPALSNVGYAFTLMRPGNTVVYFNAKEFGGNRDFPRDGRGDAIGGLYGDRITKLVSLRNTHGRGNYIQRGLEKEYLIYEREKSALVVLSNRLDGGYDSRTVQTSFAPGTPLIELTGNAADGTVDPFNDFPELLIVNADGTVNLRVPRNKAPGASGATHNRGYFVYGVSGPQGNVALSNVASTIAAETPTAATNGTARVSSMEVITANSFTLSLNTSAVTLLGVQRDRDADGDQAMFKINEGGDFNGNGVIDHLAQTTSFGFEEFANASAGYNNASGNGTFSQVINTTSLPEGMNYVTVRAWRHRNDGGPAVYTDWRKTIYVDRLKPESEVSSFLPWDAGNNENRDLIVRSKDNTANSVHVFLNLPAAMTEAQILAMIGGGNQAGQIDRDLFKYGFFGVPSGNNVATIVTYEITGNVNVQRVPGMAMATTKGRGIGDLNLDGAFTPTDVANAVNCFEQYLYSRNAQFNPAGDSNGDGLIDTRDMFAIETIYQMQAAANVQTEMRSAVIRRGNMNGQFGTDAYDIDFLYTKFGASGDLWQYDLNVDGVVNTTDVDLMIRSLLHSEYGDANLDGRVNASDFNMLAGNFGLGNQGFATGDFTGDGIVDSTDFNRFAQNYGFIYMAPAPSAALGSVVPEPASMSVILAGLAMVARRNRR